MKSHRPGRRRRLRRELLKPQRLARRKRKRGAPRSRRLAIAAQSGCIESFESLVAQFEKPLYHFLLTKTRNHHQAQDLLQDTFLITYRKLDRFNPAYPFSSWIFTIANRLAISHYRKQKPWVEEVEFAIETTASSEVIEQEWTRSLWAMPSGCLRKTTSPPFGFFTAKA